ncbi:MAG: 2,3-bisphosphoglycerate-independent phosphoglycerate mutase [Parcubacteria group bacterium]
MIIHIYKKVNVDDIINRMIEVKNPVVLLILDGWGHSTKTIGNAIHEARTPVFDMMVKNYPRILLQASGPVVGMSWDEPGNSEVGHITLGAGRIVRQYRARIQATLKDGSFFSNKVLLNAFTHAKQNNRPLHLLGLLTAGSVHADFEQLVALIQIAHKQGFKDLILHMFSDGRDSGLKESIPLLKKLNDVISKYGVGKIATVIGRTFAMDRAKNWDRTQKAYDLMLSGKGEFTNHIQTTLTKYHNEGTYDEFMPALKLDEQFSGIEPNDALIFFNFREDSMRQIFRAFIEPNFKEFPQKDLSQAYICSMTEYLPDQRQPIVFDKPEIPNSLGEVLSEFGNTQLHLAETQKYAHVTYFLNGLHEEVFPGQENVFIESYKDPKANPEMKALEIAEHIQNALDQRKYNFIVANIANADVVAHTGDHSATLKGVTATDKALGIIYNTAIHNGATLFVTSDHGNAEELIYAGTGEPESKHNKNPVPLIMIRREYAMNKTQDQISKEIRTIPGMLGDVAPTILATMGIAKPAEMMGTNLLPALGFNE